MAIYTKADYSRGVQLRTRATKQPIALDGWALELVIKGKRSDADPLLTLTTGSGLTLDADNPGRFTINMSAAQVDAIGAGDRVFAIYRTDGGQRARIMSGRLDVREGV